MAKTGCTQSPAVDYGETAETGGTSWTRADPDPRVPGRSPSTLSKERPMGAAGARTVAMLATVALAAFVASGREPSDER